MQTVMIHWERLRRFGQKLGPYLMLEVLLPGGTLLALLLFLYQRRRFSIAIPGFPKLAVPSYVTGCNRTKKP